MSKSKSSKQQVGHAHVEGIPVEIEWAVPADILSRYANNMLVQVTEHECILSFFDVPPPSLSMDQAKRSEELKASPVQKVRGVCVARVVVPLGKVPRFAEAFQTIANVVADNQKPATGKGRKNAG